jgi:purine nucleosidase
MPTRIHLDTDLGSDTDDLCALAMLLGLADVEVTGITTSTDPDGRRAGWVRHVLALAGRSDVPVAAGARASLGGLFVPLGFPDYWREPIAPAPSAPGEAVALLAASAEAGAAIVAVGPYTNIAMLEAERPGLAAQVGTVVMGGHVPPPADGFPPWGARDDFNVQQDAVAAAVVFERCDPTVVPLAACMRVSLRDEHLPALRSGGPLASLVADQGEAHARDNDRRALGMAYPSLPDDLMNLHYDPLACAVAAGWPGVTIERLPVATEMRDALLHMRVEPGARPLRVVVDVDASAFERQWLEAVLRASAAA